MREITGAELARCNGRDGAPAYIAFDGKVYDVTACFLWQGGRHQALHEAGRDLTDDLAGAPHGKDLLQRAVIVGPLVP